MVVAYKEEEAIVKTARSVVEFSMIKLATMRAKMKMRTHRRISMIETSAKTAERSRRHTLNSHQILFLPLLLSLHTTLSHHHQSSKLDQIVIQQQMKYHNFKTYLPTKLVSNPVVINNRMRMERDIKRKKER